jgi:serine/threonine-protein kinase
MAYQSNESGRREVYVRPFPGPGGKWQISTAGGSWPRWSSTGTELFYLSLDDELLAVPVSAEGGRFVAGNPAKLFDASGYVNEFFGSYDVAPRSDRFVFLEVAGNLDGAPDRSQLGFVLNWFEQVERLASSK